MVCPVAAEKPNIVFIMADDMGWQDVGFMGSTFYETPNIDKLANASLVFTDAYMYPSCSPSRTALMTGKHSFRTGAYRVPVTERSNGPGSILFSTWTVGMEHRFYSEELRDAGYRLIHLGKYHCVGPDPLGELKMKQPLKRNLGQPKNGDFSWVEAHKTPEVQKYYPTGRGYHENVGGSWWGDPARGYSEGYRSPGGGYRAPFNNPFIKEKSTDKWLTDRLTDDAIDFMKRNKNGPFFVNLNFYSPHRPTVATSPEALKKYQSKKECPITGQQASVKKEIAGYATMVENIDANVKRIIDFLDQAGLRKNTIIIFTSDNGLNGGQSYTKNLKGAKFSEHEGGLRVPALMNWPGKVSPGKTDTPILCIDYFPTFLELAGVVNYKGVLDGVSLVPLMQGKPLKRKEPLYWHLASTRPCTVMRKGNWKLVQPLLQPDQLRLYNLKDDMGEKKNLARKQPALAKQLLSEMVAWRKTNRVPVPPASPLAKQR